uniref:Uncharacterized protein n=1 Tax=Anguilla anguilla TaxID=7936 RepID=A0A0E9T210_ANGAN
MSSVCIHMLFCHYSNFV